MFYFGIVKDSVANSAKITLYDSIDSDVLQSYLEYSLASLFYYVMKVKKSSSISPPSKIIKRPPPCNILEFLCIFRLGRDRVGFQTDKVSSLDNSIPTLL